MTEAEIAAVLQSRLGAPVKIAVKRRQGHLHVLLGRSAEVQLDYPHLTDQVQAELKALALSGLEQVTVYGRELGRAEYEWEQARSLLNPTLAMPDTTISLAEKSDLLLEDLTVVAPNPVNQRSNPQPEPMDRTDTGSRFSLVWLGGALLAAGIGLAFLILAFL
ncbi:hypothetical protein [Thermostichus vulcanus]|uniref:Uncharacterized protein n=1 Tax=Thermostichus vulcanus str. 'Rupite' TaxID=2813851 RepID=A0ABT0CBB1_THEVL|nr:hypothetical protein [Thermostichus vulcanus]MCJ2543067.1 hypothetical protein [Thermostichus vulcanus str. 'Rupite']